MEDLIIEELKDMIINIESSLVNIEHSLKEMTDELKKIRHCEFGDSLAEICQELNNIKYEIKYK